MTYSEKNYSEEKIPETVKDPQSPKIWRQGEGNGGLSLLASVTTIAWNLAVPIVGGVILGNVIDNRTQGGITWTLSLLVLGVMVAFANLYNLYIEHSDRKNSAHAKPQDVSRKGKP